MSEPSVNFAIILGTQQWGLKSSWPWYWLIQGCSRSPSRGCSTLIQELRLSWASLTRSLPEVHCTYGFACHVPCWSRPGCWPAASWMYFWPMPSLWYCLAIPGHLADPGYCSAPLLSGCLGAVLLSVRPLPRLPFCHPWLPVCLPLWSRKLSVLPPDANSYILF